MNAALLKSLVVAGSLAAGAVIGTGLSKVVLDKFPGAKPVVVWASGALVGVGVTLLAPATKSEVASILATPVDSE